MFEFLEVPSPVNGAIGEVASGVNYDWYRQDTKPGLMNLNLIIDEEVFLGLMGNAGMVNEDFNANIGPNSVSASGINSMATALSNNQLTNPQDLAVVAVETGEVDNGLTAQNSFNQPYSYLFVPKVVTMTDPNTGSPASFRNAPAGSSYQQNHVAAYPIPNKGFMDLSYAYTPANGAYTLAGDSRLKACFTDFLKLRHGGSGYLFGFGYGAVGTPYNTGNVNTSNFNIAAERPFRSLSFPDINYTIMRPAPLPPSTTPPPTTVPPSAPYATLPGTAPAGYSGTWPPTSLIDPTTGFFIPTLPSTLTPAPMPLIAWDPGVRNPYLYMPAQVAVPGSPGTPEMPPATPPPTPVRRLFQIPDGHSSNADSYVGNSLGDISVNVQTLVPSMAGLSGNGTVDLTSAQATTVNNVALGSNTGSDARQHPYFRSEWMQRIANLTTVRTHQYAVWITVGFFEVTQQGDALMANDPNYFDKAYDRLGLELGILNGRNVRYRSFFLLDRTRATGFDPASPGNFRDVVVYRKSLSE